MKILKKIVLVILVLIAIPLVTTLFTKKSYHVERTVDIEQSKQRVFDYIKYLKNQDHYSKWATMDPEMKKTYTGTDGTVGFIAAWDSDDENVGKGEQEIIKISEGERVDFELRFFEPFQSTEPAYMTTTALNDSLTKVAWGFSGHMDYPMNLMLLMMDFEQMIGDDLAHGLNQLKTVLEK